jgi:hypothetical protein
VPPALVVPVGGLLVGALTSVAQAVLPTETASLANSAGSWSLAAFALCLTNRRPQRGAVLGAVALLAMVVGYAVLTEVRDFTASTRLVLFWGLAAVTVGPALGVGAAWSRGPHLDRRALAAGLIAGILIGEGVYGLTVVAGTTSPGYWIVQGLVGVAIVVGRIGLRLRDRRATVLCASATAAVAAAFYVAYAANPTTLLAG